MTADSFLSRGMARKVCLASRAGVAAVLLACAFAHQAIALINPRFTPVQVVDQSQQILVVKLAPTVGGKIVATILRTLKGKTDAEAVILDVGGCWRKEHAQAFEEKLKKHAAAGGPVLFFVSPPAEEEEDAAASATAFMHLDGVWAVFVAQGGDRWLLTEYDNLNMSGAWQGGTDMLLRAVEYILADPGAEIPSMDGVNFDEGHPFGRLPGKVSRAAPVDLAGDGKLALFVACDAGDRFYSYDAAAKNLKDVTPSHATSSRSRAFAWADFNSDGRLDLASWDGQAVTVYQQNTDGAFEAGAKLAKDTFKGDVASLAALDAGDGRPGVLVGTESAMYLWTPAGKGVAPRTIGDGSVATNIGKDGRCVVADFDGDGIPDILQCFEKGSVLCKGKTVGQFEEPRVIGLGVGAGRSDAFLGDYDADGLLDLITISEDACKVWQNEGNFRFTEALRLSGEVGYKVRGGAVSGMTCDFNNDGRQDFLLVYSGQTPTQFFYNRGFRTFGFAGQLGADLNRMVPDAKEGQQAGCMADFNRDGTPDLVLILKNGDGWLLPMAGGGATPAIRAALPPNSTFAGPLTVTGWREGRCLGAWNVMPGTDEAFVAWPDAGPLTLKWLGRKGEARAKEIVLVDKAVRFVLAP